MDVRAAYTFVLAFSLTMALIPPLVRFAVPLGLMDKGGGRKVHEGLVPRTGGVAVFVGFIVPTLVWVPFRLDLSAFLAASVLLFAFGVLDDRFNLDYRLKLLGQVAAALVATLAGGILIERVPFFYGGVLPASVAVPLTVFVLVGVTNAVNLSDGLDGLAGGISLLALACLCLLANQGGDGAVVLITLATIGAVFGFLRFNTFPARLFMGDTGSQFLGFSTGVLALIVTQRSDPALSPAVPLLVLGLPILDTLRVMVLRVARGQSPFQADRTHIHHRLLASGLTQYEAVSLVYGVQFLLVVLAYLLRYSLDGAILLTYAATCMLILVGLREAERHATYLGSRAKHQHLFGRLVARARRTWLLAGAPFNILRFGLPLLLVTGALVASSVSADILVLSAGLFGVLLVSLVVKSLLLFMIERLSAYAAAATVAFLLERSDGLMDACGFCLHMVYGALALVTVLWVRVSTAHFKVSSLDVLILLGALVAPMLRGLGLRHIGVVALESIVLFYAIEVVLQERERGWSPLRVGVLAALGILTVRGLLG